MITLITPYVNHTFNTTGELLLFMGYPPFQNILMLTLFPVLALLGFTLNLISLSTLLHARFTAQPIYHYIRVSLLASLACNILQLLFCVSINLNSDLKTNSYFIQAFMAFIFTPLYNTLTYFKFIIEALCTLDRIATLKPRVARTFFRFSAHINSLIGLALVVFLLIPHYLYFWPCTYHIRTDKGIMEKFYMVDSSPFANTRLGQIIVSTFLVIRFLVVFTLDISLNTVLIYSFKQYFTNCPPTVVRYRLSKTSNGRGGLYSLSRASAAAVGSRKEQIEKSVTRMVVAMQGMSIVHQIVMCVNFVVTWWAGGVNEQSSLFILLSITVSSVRHASNFFIFLAFSFKFKAELRRKYRLARHRFCACF
jgi:hypothetical protein